MTIIGIKQILCGTLLLIAGWYLAQPPAVSHPILGIVCMAFGAYVVSTSVTHIDPTGV